MIELDQPYTYRNPVVGRGLDVALALRRAMEIDPKKYNIPVPIIYGGPDDFPSVFTAYTKPDHIKKGLSMIFLATHDNPRALAQDTNRDLNVAVCVDTPVQAERLAYRLRATGSVCLPKLYLQRQVGGIPVEIEKLTDLQLLNQIRALQNPNF